MANNNNFVLLTGTANIPLAESIAKILKTEVHMPVSRFADGEAHVQIPVNVRKRDVFIIQPTCPPNVDKAYIELFAMINAARLASAGEITAVVPYFGYSRQDRKDRPRTPVMAGVMAKALETFGANRIVTVDIHTEQAEGFVASPWDNLPASFVFIPLLQKLNLKNLVIASPDKGGVPRANFYAKKLRAEGLAIVYKERDVFTKNTSQALTMIGDVNGKTVLLVDDMIDTAGTICHAADLIKQRGAKSVMAVATHGLFSADALEKVQKSVLQTVYIADTVPLKKEAEKMAKIKMVKTAKMLAGAIECIRTGESISQKFYL
ncbi:ribose-phosphate diphosphokinase [Candidatus Daviesbacteria bacterium]|nr:ribose-phosphate diphosphokinase [Candidatus Daviesbacteria bacterium]